MYRLVVWPYGASFQESTGKSTLLERLTGLPIFPRNADLCVLDLPYRFSLTIRWDVEEEGSVMFQNKLFTSFILKACSIWGRIWPEFCFLIAAHSLEAGPPIFHQAIIGINAKTAGLFHLHLSCPSFIIVHQPDQPTWGPPLRILLPVLKLVPWSFVWNF